MRCKKIIILITIVVVFICLNNQNVSASSYESDTLEFLNEEIEISEGQYDSYTDDDWAAFEYGNDEIAFSIFEYTEEDYGIAGYSMNYITKPEGATFGRVSIWGDDPIVSVVPKELFAHRGDYLYIGKEYGFFIETSPYLLLNDANFVDLGVNKCNVFIFDFELDYTKEMVNLNHDNINYKIQPLYTCTFFYLSEYAFGNINEYSFVWTGIPYRVTYNYDQINDFDLVIPYPAATGELTSMHHGLEYCQDYSALLSSNDNYGIKDVAVSMVIENENNLNIRDENYDYTSDNGLRLERTYMTMNGEKGNEHKEDTINSGVGLLFDWASLALTGTKLQAYMELFENTKLFVDTYKYVNQITIPLYYKWDVDNLNENPTIVTADKWYSNENNNNPNRIWKHSYNNITSQISSPHMFFPKLQNNTKGQITFNYECVSLAPCQSRLTYYTYVQIAKRTDRGIEIVNENIGYNQKIVDDKDEKELDLEMNNSAYILENGSDLFTFTPDYSGQYELFAYMRYVSIKMITSNGKEITSKGNSITYNLIENQTYKFVIFFDDFWSFIDKDDFRIFNIDFKIKSIDIGEGIEIKQQYTNQEYPGIENIFNNNSTLVFKFIPESNDLYNFSIMNANSIKLKNKNFEEMTKIQINNIDYSASNIYGNGFSIYLNAYDFYYIIIDGISNYNDLSLNITNYNDTISLDDQNNYNDQMNLALGDDFIKFEAPFTGQFAIEMKYDNYRSAQEFSYVIYDIPRSESYHYKIDSINYYFTRNITLTQGEFIYIGYMNSNISVANFDLIVREKPITDLDLEADPTWAKIVGTEVNVNKKARGEKTIAVGFTRCIYLSTDAPITARQSYNWTSSNPNVATVSSYGTVTAHSVGVTSIRAALNANPKYVGIIDIIVYEQKTTGEHIVNITTDCRESAPLYGTEVSSGVGLPGENIIHIGFTRLICFNNKIEGGSGSPSTSIQDYIWTSSNSSIASVSIYGTIKGLYVGEVEISGVYKYNNSYKASLIIKVV